MSAAETTISAKYSLAKRARADADLEERIAQVSGLVNAAAGKLVELVGEALDTGAWKGDGIHTPAQYVAWKCGLSGGGPGPS